VSDGYESLSAADGERGGHGGTDRELRWLSMGYQGDTDEERGG